MNLYLGFDGGGTKTECIALDAEGRISGHGNSGPSNPLRVGYDAACAALQLAAAAAITSAKYSPSDVRGICAGLAGAGRRNVAEEMRSRLSRIWPGAPIQIVTDAEAALETAVGAEPGVVLIAGTGSIALGRNAKGDLARAGGYGPWIGDAGSAYDIGRHATLAVARARDLAAPATLLAEMILSALNCRAWDDVVEKLAAGPGSVFPKLVPVVMQAAEDGDSAARHILTHAALDLANIALAVIGRLNMKDSEFCVARVGGVFGRNYILDSRVDDLIVRAAPGAHVGLLEHPPALGAARVAIRQAHTQGATHGRTI
jgi:N-acetylglucosamine kinase-like BadF-type ATPase